MIFVNEKSLFGLIDDFNGLIKQFLWIISQNEWPVGFTTNIFPFLLRIHWRTQARTHTRSLLCQCFWILNSLKNLIFNLPIQCDVLENSMQKLLLLISFMHTHSHIQWSIRTHRVANFNSSKAKQSKAKKKKGTKYIRIHVVCALRVSVYKYKYI